MLLHWCCLGCLLGVVGERILNELGSCNLTTVVVSAVMDASPGLASFAGWGFLFIRLCDEVELTSLYMAFASLAG